jgi:prepilin-type N-terminal cleavage/methylation domain-containing protein
MQDVIRDPRRSGFTAIELIVVIGIMLLLSGMAVPGLVTSLRRGAVHAGANDLIDCWRQARGLALDEVPLDAKRDEAPRHYGLLIVQRGAAQAYAEVVYDSRSADDVAGGTARADDLVLAKHALKRSVRIALARAADDAPRPLDGALLIYAQYGTGLPIAAEDVVAGRGPTAPAIGLGIAGRPELGIPGSTLAARLRLQTLDYAETPRRRGHAVDLALFPVGVMAALDG